MQYKKLIKSRDAGFTLPVVLIASVVLLMVLASVGVYVSSSVSSLDAKHYDLMAKQAAKSGAARVDACLQASEHETSWGSNSLTPGTDCAGVSVSAQGDYLSETDRYRVTYVVEPPESGGSGVQTAKVTGKVSLLRKSTGQEWRSYSHSLIVRTGGQVSTEQVVLGYVYSKGVFFGVVGRDGKMRTVGYNGDGQLGNGSKTNSLTPTNFKTPKSSVIKSGYSSFVSTGFRMYAVDSDGIAYGAGKNDWGSLGVGINNGANQSEPTPKKVVLPSGKSIVKIAVGQNNSYFVTSDGDVYVSGSCEFGALGNDYDVSTCASHQFPVRAQLPFGEKATTEIVTDYNTVYVRTESGAVYGWGHNLRAQLGKTDLKNTSKPVKIGNYGNPGAPQAKQLAFDGDTLYVLDSNGDIKSLGGNQYGSMGNRDMYFRMDDRTVCLRATGSTLSLDSCSAGNVSRKFEYRPNGQLYSAYTNRCVHNTSGSNVAMRSCQSTPNNRQKFDWNPYTGRMRSLSANRCLENQGGDHSTVWLWVCDPSGAGQRLQAYSEVMTDFNTSGISGKFTKIWTDQWSISGLTDRGEVWSAGINSGGQFGNGTNQIYQPEPVKFKLPAGVKAVDLHETFSGPIENPLYQNLYVIGDDGRVYGAGNNTFGQLGNGTTASRVTNPVVMDIIDGVNITASEVQTGYGTTVIFATSGAVYTVGNNSHGQLGDGTTNNKNRPIKAKYINVMDMKVY